MSRIKIVTDSAADIPAELRRQWDIEVLPFPIEAGEREYLDGEDLSAQEFYVLLQSLPDIPTHAQLTGYVFEQCYERAYLAGYADLIYTSINSKASATCQNALQAREEFFEDHPEAKGKFEITIIDSLTYTMGYGWAVLQGAKLAAGGADAGEVASCIRGWVDRVRILFVPYDLKFAKKSGRVSAAAAFAGEALGLKPIMTFEDGVSKVLTKVRGEKNVVPAILNICREEREEGMPYLIIRAGNAAQADLLSSQAAETLGQAPDLEYYIGGVIAINAGPNLAGIIYWKK